MIGLRIPLQLRPVRLRGGPRGWIDIWLFSHPLCPPSPVLIAYPAGGLKAVGDIQPPANRKLIPLFLYTFHLPPADPTPLSTPVLSGTRLPDGRCLPGDLVADAAGA